MLCVLPLVPIFSLWGRARGGDLIYRACRHWDDAWLWLIGIRHTNIFESPFDTERQYVFVANHISYLDIPVILQAIRHHSFRVLGKVEIARIPLFGYIYSRTVVMVDRSRPDQRLKSLRELRSLLKEGISVFLFPEGTFNETHQPLKEFYDGAFRIAIETQTPIQPVIFPDTYDRMHYSSFFTLNPGPCRAIFLPACSVEGLSFSDLPALKARVYRQMEAKLLELRASWIR
jgi:1-acyl-sn-glycerol-3-phosphate acyltransferase